MKGTYTEQEVEILMRAAFMLGTECPVQSEVYHEDPTFDRIQYLSGRCTQALQIIRSNEQEFLNLHKKESDETQKQ